MEGLFGLIGIIVLWFIGSRLVGMLFGAGASTVKAAAKAATGKGSFSDNMRLEFKGLGPLEVRLRNDQLDDDDNTPILRLEARGLFPVAKKTHVGFMTSVFDETEGEKRPVLTHVDIFQELETIAFQHRVEVAEVEPNMGFTDWVQIGAVIPEVLEPPLGGQRKLMIAVRMVDLNNPPELSLGFGDAGLWIKTLNYAHHHDGKGYEGQSKEEDEGKELSLQLGMAVAMSDESLDDAEGLVLQDWVRKMITPYSDERQTELKELYNATMRDTHQKAKRGDLALSEIADRLNEIDNETIKLDAIELAFQVMSADGTADPRELTLLNKIAESLGVDYEQIEKFKDQNILKLDSSVTSEQSMEVLLDVDPDWDSEQINTHLRTLFQRWNGRLNALDDGPERVQAQHMIDLIGRCQNKYANKS